MWGGSTSGGPRVFSDMPADIAVPPSIPKSPCKAMPRRLATARAHQLKVISDRLQFYIDRGKLSGEVLEKLRSARQSLLDAAEQILDLAEASKPADNRDCRRQI